MPDFDNRLDAEKSGYHLDGTVGRVPAPPADPTAQRRRLVALAVAMAGALMMAVFVAREEGARREAANPPAPTALNLKAERVSGQVVLSWNGSASSVQEATRAILKVVDGDHEEEVDLDRDQLGRGSIIYSPITSNLTFTLTIERADGTKPSATVRVYEAKPPAQ